MLFYSTVNNSWLSDLSRTLLECNTQSTWHSGIMGEGKSAEEKREEAAMRKAEREVKRVEKEKEKAHKQVIAEGLLAF